MTIGFLSKAKRYHLGHLISVFQRTQWVILLNKETWWSQDVPDQPEITCGSVSVRAIPEEEVFDLTRFSKLSRLAQVSELTSLPRYKSKQAKSPDRSLFALSRPVILATLLFNQKTVVSGFDVKAELDAAVSLLRKFSAFSPHGDKHNIPVTMYRSTIRDLKLPELRMSASHPFGCIFLNDGLTEIADKISKADESDGGIENLQAINVALGGDVQGRSVTRLKDEVTTRIARTFKLL